ncbi:hypothetical protein Acr_23g0006570 [Actinidia rufa]|uniref:Uncharacterized protein n=1 Tax=Actinidia rufa TaxID=165716 RepID=A0A7J0GNB3_9ERIC|nr:hypothetical protein Acr_23g0006570 [Actinidia rufa]
MAWGLIKGVLSCKSLSVPWHPLGITLAIIICLSFQHGYYSELADQRHLRCNETLACTVPLLATAPSSDAEDLRVHRARQLGGDHCPSKAGVPSNVNRTPTQDRPSLLTSNSPFEVLVLVRPSDVIM